MPHGDKKLRPTVIGLPGAALRKRMDSGAKEDTAQARVSTSRAAAAVVRQPTAMPGVERSRVNVPAGELERLWLGAPAQVYAQARALIETFVADKATERRAILWGQDLQQEYSDLVGEALNLTRSAALRKVEGYLARTMDILESIDLLAACGHGSSGVVGRMIQRMNARIDTPGELAQAHAELETLVALMAAALQDLLDLKDRLLAVAERTDAAGAQLQAASIAASFLSEHLRNEKDAVSQRFAERAMSLAQSVALIREGGTTRSLQIEQPMRMISAIQDVALVVLPGFISSIAAATALSSARTTPTEAGELTYRLREIIDQLKSPRRAP